MIRWLVRWTLRLVLAVLALAAAALAFMRWQADRRETQIAAEVAPRTGRFVKAHDVELFVQERGDPSGPAVVFVHGTGAWSETWLPAMDAASAAGFRAI